jgi:hypothetical protein
MGTYQGTFGRVVRVKSLGIHQEETGEPKWEAPDLTYDFPLLDLFQKAARQLSHDGKSGGAFGFHEHPQSSEFSGDIYLTYSEAPGDVIDVTALKAIEIERDNSECSEETLIQQLKILANKSVADVLVKVIKPEGDKKYTLHSIIEKDKNLLV